MRRAARARRRRDQARRHSPQYERVTPIDHEVRRAHLLALVAAVQPITERRAPPPGRLRALGPARPSTGARRRPQPRQWRRSDTSRCIGGTIRNRRRPALGMVSAALVTTEPSTNHDPRPGNRMFALLPYHPRPARYAASRSTSELSSAITRLPPGRRQMRGDGAKPVGEKSVVVAPGVAGDHCRSAARRRGS